MTSRRRLHALLEDVTHAVQQGQSRGLIFRSLYLPRIAKHRCFTVLEAFLYQGGSGFLLRGLRFGHH